eukprot:2977313-Rhodomonas_salina.1
MHGCHAIRAKGWALTLGVLEFGKRTRAVGSISGDPICYVSAEHCRVVAQADRTAHLLMLTDLLLRMPWLSSP